MKESSQAKPKAYFLSCYSVYDLVAMFSLICASSSLRFWVAAVARLRPALNFGTELRAALNFGLH